MLNRMRPARTASTRTLFALMVAALLFGGGRASAQSPEVADILKRAFVNREFASRPFGPARWLEDGKAYTTVEPSQTVTGGADIVRYETATGKRELLVAASQLILPGAKGALRIEGYEWSADLNRVLIFTNSQRVWRQNTRGDYWLLDRKAGTLRKLGGDAPESSLLFATFSPDETRVAYVRGNNLYVEDLGSGKITPLTSDGSATIINGTSDWVYEEELGLRDAFRWSPDGTQIAYYHFDTSKVKKFPLVYDDGAPYQVVTHLPYPEAGLYPNIVEVPYPEAGTANSSVRIGVVPASGGATRWMQLPGSDSDNYVARMEWAGDPHTLILERLNRLQNTNDLLLADAATGAIRSMYQDHDDAWVDVVDDLRWVHGGKELVWESERDGWRHVYLISRDGKQKLVTPGDFDVVSVLGVDAQEQWLYYIASPENPTQRYLYRGRLDGSGKPERVTPSTETGTNTYNVSPDLRWAFHVRSSFDQPPQTDLVSLPDHHSARVLQDNTKALASVKALGIPPAEFTRVDVGDGLMLDAWLIKPRNFDPAKKYPMLVYVYGEPAGQTTADRWDGAGGIFHRALALDGYIVASFDNSGTPSPRGRAWRKVVYGGVGVLSSKQQALALQALEKSKPYIDPERVAVWGWSGGGTNTLNLMFRHPELYKVGMAVAPVPDQRLYDTIYQERYMGLPQQNVEGYKESSAVNFVEGLRGKLLLVHGSGDDNVHFQGSELLVNRMIELGKTFDFMDYPGRTHAISEGRGTTLHLYSLLARYLEEHLPAGPAQAAAGHP